MRTAKSQPKTVRFEARINAQQKELFQHAADLSGRSLTDFAISALLETAKRIIQEHSVIKLSQRDQEVFLKELTNPSKPNKALLKAIARYKRGVKDDGLF